MKVLVFDTETTGLPTERIRAKLKRGVWPHIVSIAWIVYDTEEEKIVTQKSYIIKPIDWVIPEQSTAIHGIMHKYAERYGSSLSDVIDEFLRSEHDIMLAHNLDFDENVLVQAIMWDLGRTEFPGFLNRKACSMQLTRDLCKLPFSNGGHGYKSPKLSELYEHVFHKKPRSSKLHGAYYDTKILTDILRVYEPLRVRIGLQPRPIENTTNETPTGHAYIQGTTLIL